MTYKEVLRKISDLYGDLERMNKMITSLDDRLVRIEKALGAFADKIGEEDE